MRFVWATLFAAAVWFVPSPVSACDVVRIPPSEELVAQADAIVLAVAREFVPNTEVRQPSLEVPDVLDFTSIGILHGRIRFEIRQTLKGQINAQTALLFPGLLTDRDDFNETSVPQNWPRKEARGGNCFALTYRRDGTYLLLLKTRTGDTLDPYWSALGRVNDQVRPEGDEWVDWVRRQAN